MMCFPGITMKTLERPLERRPAWLTFNGPVASGIGKPGVLRLARPSALSLVAAREFIYQQLPSHCYFTRGVSQVTPVSLRILNSSCPLFLQRSPWPTSTRLSKSAYYDHCFRPWRPCPLSQSWSGTTQHPPARRCTEVIELRVVGNNALNEVSVSGTLDSHGLPPPSSSGSGSA